MQRHLNLTTTFYINLHPIMSIQILRNIPMVFSHGGVKFLTHTFPTLTCRVNSDIRVRFLFRTAGFQPFALHRMECQHDSWRLNAGIAGKGQREFGPAGKSAGRCDVLSRQIAGVTHSYRVEMRQGMTIASGQNITAV